MNYRINENLCQAKLSIIRRITDLALENKQPDERVVPVVSPRTRLCRSIL